MTAATPRQPRMGGIVNDCDFIVGTEAGNVINVAIQLSINGVDADQRVAVHYYLSSDASGDTVRADPGTVAIGTDGTIIVEDVDDVVGLMISEADGDIDLNITDASAETLYLNLILPTGRVVTSPAITFA